MMKTHSLPCHTIQQALVKFVSSPEYMGEIGAPSSWQSMFMKCTAAVMYLVNAVVLVLPGGGLFGDLIQNSTYTCEFIALVILLILTCAAIVEFIHLNTFLPIIVAQRASFVVLAALTEILYFGWNLSIAYIPIKLSTSIPICNNEKKTST